MGGVSNSATVTPSSTASIDVTNKGNDTANFGQGHRIEYVSPVNLINPQNMHSNNQEVSRFVSDVGSDKRSSFNNFDPNSQIQESYSYQDEVNSHGVKLNHTYDDFSSTHYSSGAHKITNLNNGYSSPVFPSTLHTPLSSGENKKLPSSFFSSNKSKPLVPPKGLTSGKKIAPSNKPLPKVPTLPSLAKIPLPVQPPRMDATTLDIVGHVTGLRKLERGGEQTDNESNSSPKESGKTLTEEEKVGALTANGFKADCVMKKDRLDKAWSNGTLMQQIQAWKGPVIVAVGKPGEKILYTYMKDEKGNSYLCHCEAEQSAKQKLTIKQPIQVSPIALLNSLASSTETKYAIELYRIEKRQAPQPLYIDLTEQAGNGKSKENDNEDEQDEHQQKIDKTRGTLMTQLGIDEKYDDALDLEIEKDD
jgi:hypothetical protein